MALENHTIGRVVGVDTRDSIGTTNVGLFWSMIEMGVGMVAICLPSLRPLLKGRIPGFSTRKTGGGEETYSLPKHASDLGTRRSQNPFGSRGSSAGLQNIPMHPLKGQDRDDVE